MKRILVVLTVIAGIGSAQAVDPGQAVHECLAQATINDGNVYSVSLAIQVFLNPHVDSPARKLLYDNRWTIKAASSDTFVLQGPSKTYGDPNSPYQPGATFNLAQILYLVLVYESMELGKQVAQNKSIPSQFQFDESVNQIVSRTPGISADQVRILKNSAAELAKDTKVLSWLQGHPDALAPLTKAIEEENKNDPTSRWHVVPWEPYHKKRPNYYTVRGIKNPGCTCFMNSTLQAVCCVLRHLGNLKLKGEAGEIINQLGQELLLQNPKPIEIQVLAHRLLPFFETFNPPTPQLNPTDLGAQNVIVANLSHVAAGSGGESLDAGEFLSCLTEVLETSEMSAFFKKAYKSRPEARQDGSRVQAMLIADVHPAELDGLPFRLHFDRVDESTRHFQGCTHTSSTRSAVNNRVTVSLKGPDGQYISSLSQAPIAETDLEISSAKPKKCRQCSTRRNATAKLTTRYLPPVLILNLLRGIVDDPDHLIGDTAPVGFAPVIKVGGSDYVLVAEQQHHPNHYTTWMLMPDGTWQHAADSSVTTCRIPPQDQGNSVGINFYYVRADKYIP
ncbi:MAG: ubiquitin carboxyl-terminal hydrolase [Holosporales bacterium]|jgi:ubiquitin C-terminal hydrolase|nr:ubiquitin carboxyl-terminal hydrolase [Holosporales bacterium]